MCIACTQAQAVLKLNDEFKAQSVWVTMLDWLSKSSIVAQYQLIQSKLAPMDTTQHNIALHIA